MSSVLNNKAWLWLECLVIFVGIPVLLWLRLLITPLIMIPLFIVCIPAGIWLGRRYGFTRATFWQGDPAEERVQLRRIIKRFLFNALLLVGLLLLCYPQHLFDLPRNMTMLWLLIIVLYPLFSVYPQELLYRTFFLQRYQALFRDPRYLVLLNALLFGWMHIVFHNVLAVVFTLIGGLLFADTYRKTRSLRLTCLEHALYGNLLFTLGYGQAFLFTPLLDYFKGL